VNGCGVHHAHRRRCGWAPSGPRQQTAMPVIGFLDGSLEHHLMTAFRPALKAAVTSKEEREIYFPLSGMVGLIDL